MAVFKKLLLSSLFVLGTVSCNTDNGQAPVAVAADSAPPVIQVPADVQANSQGTQTWVALGVATANDVIDGAVTVTDDAPKFFPMGVTEVRYTAIDSSGNTTVVVQRVTVVDGGAPRINVHDDVVVEAVSANGTRVAYTLPTSLDEFDFHPHMTCIPASGSVFALGNNDVVCTATDTAGNRAQSTFSILVQDTQGPRMGFIAPLEATSPDGNPVAVTLPNPVATDLFAPVILTHTAPALFPLGDTLVDWTATDANGNATVAKQRVTVTLPAPPAAARALAANGFAAPYRSLIPHDITVPRYDEQRFSIITGLLQDINGNPVAGIQVSVHDFPELGTTQTDASGRFSLPVEGGGLFTVDFESSDYLFIQRKVQTQWNQIHTTATVTLLGKDSKVTIVEFDGNPATKIVHRSTPIADERGTRATTLVFSGDTVARIKHPDGTITPLTEPLQVRATEFTTPESMPGELPATSAFTFATDLTVAGIEPMDSVEFNRPVAMYVDNFIGFPVGEAVPVGFYDRAQAVWVPIDNGVVVQLLDLDNDGKVDALDATGDGLPDDLNNNASFIDEVAGISQDTAYQAGASYWRVEITHFTPYDLNWPISIPVDARKPDPPPPVIESTRNCPDEIKECTGSGVFRESRIFTEDIPVAGTNLRLHYRSSRADGFKQIITVPVTGDTLPVSLKRVTAKILVAGKWFYFSNIPALPNQSVEVVWDGNDVYGGTQQSSVLVQTQIGFVYNGLYAMSRRVQRSFALAGSGSSLGSASRQKGRAGAKRIRATAKTFTIDIIKYTDNQRIFSLGGARGKNEFMQEWSLSDHHEIERKSDRAVLKRGDGTHQDLNYLSTPTVSPFVRVLSVGNGGEPKVSDALLADLDNGDAMEILVDPRGIELAPDGSLYFADRAQHKIRRIDRDGHLTTVAGTGATHLVAGDGDGGLATEAALYNPYDIVFDPQGNLYIADSWHHSVRKVDTHGIITTIAGTGANGSTGDDGLASQATLSNPFYLAMDGAGNLYVSESTGHRVRKISPDGYIHTVAGTGLASGALGDGGLAIEARINAPRGIAVNAEGDLYIAEYNGYRIRKVAPDGIISTIAGTGSSLNTGDEGLAIEAAIYRPTDLQIAADGSLYFTVGGGTERKNGIRKISSAGIITTLAGNRRQLGPLEDGILATQAVVNEPDGIAVMADGQIIMADGDLNNIRQIDNEGVIRTLAGGSDQALIKVIGLSSLIDPERQEGYEFDDNDRHIRTFDLDTGVTLQTFGYDAEGYLSQITDRFNNTTRIDYQTLAPTLAGVIRKAPIALIAPDGQRTELHTPDGTLHSVSYPDSSRYDFVYGNGLMTSKTDPNGHIYRYRYDHSGRIIETEDAATGVTHFSTANEAGVLTATTVDQAGRRYFSQRQQQPDQGQFFKALPQARYADASLYVLTDKAGLDTVTLTDRRRRTTQVDAPDGHTTLTTQGIDPEYGSRRDLTLTLTQPSGLQLTAASAIVYDRPAQQTTASSVQRERTVNGQTTTQFHDILNSQRLTTTPAGRELTQHYQPDTLLTTLIEPAGLASTSFAYDSRGRLSQIIQGTGLEQRHTLFAYDSLGHLASLTDAAGRQNQFNYDPMGRLTQHTQPDGRSIAYTFDANGNLTRLTPPGSPVHQFNYTPVNLTADYTPPTAGQGDPTTHYHYNLAQQLTQITRPDGQTLTLTYDSAGRLNTQTLPRGDLTTRYSPTTGQLTDLTAPGNETLSYAYDGRLLLSETSAGSINGSVGFNYDTDFRVIRQTVNGLDPVHYRYDLDGLLTQSGDLSLSRDAQHGLITATALGSVTTQTHYNGFGEPTHITASDTLTPLIDTQYTRDPLGRITQTIETLQGTATTTDYTYDLAGRLSEAYTNGSLTDTYTYDANGNRLSHNAATATVDAQDRLLTYNGTAYTYTHNGELSSKTDPTGTTVYHYDLLGNLMQVILPDTTQIDTLIDGRNRRIGKKINGTLTQGFLYQNQLNPVAELDGAGNVRSRFIYGSKANVPDYLIKGGTTYRILTDHLGSPRLVVNTTDGSIAQRIDYDAFGNVTLDTHPGFQPFGFAGGLYDIDTGLTRFGARDYDPETGRWTAKDPIRFNGGDTNLYGYVLGDPVNLIDSNGLLFTGTINALKRNPIPQQDAIRLSNNINVIAVTGVATVALAPSVIAAGSGAIISTALRNPELITGAQAFTESALLSGPPVLSTGGIAGFLLNNEPRDVVRKILNNISQVHKEAVNGVVDFFCK